MLTKRNADAALLAMLIRAEARPEWIDAAMLRECAAEFVCKLSDTMRSYYRESDGKCFIAEYGGAGDWEVYEHTKTLNQNSGM